MSLKLIIQISLLFVGLKISAQEPSLEHLFQSELQQKNENVTSIKCDFIQERNISVLNSSVSKEGTFYFTKPCNMLLAFNDGDYIKMTSTWFEMSTAGHVSAKKSNSNPMFRNLNSILTACVVGDFDKIKKGFDIQYSKSATDYIVTLIPQRGKAISQISRIIISFDKTNMSLNDMQMIEKSGNSTSYTFKNKEFNLPLDSKLFNITE